MSTNAVLFICSRRRFSAPCGHHAERHRGCCPLCSARSHRQGGRGRRGTGRRCPSPRPGRRLLEESKAAALDQMTTAARQHVPSSSSSLSSPTAASQLIPTASSTYENTVVAGLHFQAAAVLNICQLVNIILDSSTNYASWRDLMEQALQRYALIKHITNDTPSNDPGWIRMDNNVLNWVSNSISTDLRQMVRQRGCTAHHLWLTIENQFLGNREQRTLHLDAAFHTFAQGDLSVNEYCRKFKAMADSLADLGAPVEDRILVLNILRGLNLMGISLYTWSLWGWFFLASWTTFRAVRTAAS
jgi:hypothetical protein